MILGVKLTMRYMAAQMGKAEAIEIVPMTETGEPYRLNASETFLAFSKKKTDPALAADFSKTLAAMKADGTIDQIERAYYK